MFICQFCSRTFTTRHAYTQHEKYHCKLNPDRQKVNQTKFYTEHKKAACKVCGRLIDVANIKKHEASCGNSKREHSYHVSHEGLNCIFCGKLCKNKNSLTQHELRCKENPNRKSYENLSAFNIEIAEIKASGKLNKQDCPRVAKAAETLRQRYLSGNLIPAAKNKPGTFSGCKHTEEIKAKIRISTLRYLENNLGVTQARYNVSACRYIDFLNSQFGWNLQHAENGGEARVCGYFLDGYDYSLNIAFEYDEPKHYSDVDSNTLCEKDIARMRNIITELNCRFIRYNERLQLLYEIDENLNWNKL